MTNFATLADTYAAKKIALEALTAEVDELKKQIIETGTDVIEGARFKVTVSLGERTSVSAKEVEKLLSPELFATVSKTTVYPAVRYKAIKA
jgi:hypothetical protein